MSMMVHFYFYTAIIQSILTYAAATAKDRVRWRIDRSAEKVIDYNLPLLKDLYASRTLTTSGRDCGWPPPQHPRPWIQTFWDTPLRQGAAVQNLTP